MTIARLGALESAALRSRMADAEECAAITRQHARTFSMASRFLSSEKRRAAFAIYAFCRLADDIVDEAASTDTAATRAALANHRVRLAETLRGRPRGPVFRELSWAIRRFDIPGRPFHELINALYDDLEPGEISTWDELARYCGGVASTVGEMCAHVFGLPDRGPARQTALRQARVLGIALQLTNILRDVGEDAGRGRCYLPIEDLRAFGFSRADVLAGTIDPASDGWQQLMRFQIERARALYADADPGLALVDSDARCCATICARGYAAILEAIERRRYDSIGGRARVGTSAKARIMLSAWHQTRRMIQIESRGEVPTAPPKLALVTSRDDRARASVRA